ncbi:hypothetical protein OAE88_00755, partial [bacterium]|nr:hypothetical protein [bacterium]
ILTAKNHGSYIKMKMAMSRKRSGTIQKVIMIILVLTITTACTTIKKNEEGKYEINPVGTIIRAIIGIPDQLQFK